MGKLAIYQEGSMKLKLFYSVLKDQVKVCIVDEDGCIDTSICAISARGIKIYDISAYVYADEFECDEKGRIKVLD